ncbi:NAD(P)H-hydrate dehydratase [Candidatus Daviesbacteria bacterium RIFCSPHIGHO2_02_FULL_41_10]|uniref:ADP-dependent (S)-NAD(P)H-hydrate dehydratase n=2 Tax=Candidatus Daviesiibacteriota TaxID=1752718 RepID=A0A1F5JXZ6_9BACT|nr:MAG: NAD(P)H-hydrate dehydratase [Candidatus Daviesbacteria bacterium RIFCSPHIGHO2_02_FULL_41_10]
MDPIEALTKEWVAKKLPARPKDASKGTFGKVLVFAGSENYPGAAYLACTAAYRIGAGLVTLATDQTVKIIVSRRLPEVTFLSSGEALKKLGEYDVLLVGPGLGQNNQATEFVKQLCSDYSNNRYKMVIDGDGLNVLSKMGKWWERFWTSQNDKATDIILTPHPGEMARLTGLTIAKIQSDRIPVAQYFAKKWQKIIVLKGAETVIASPDGGIKISPFANPVLATAGTGDVLSGMIAGFLAQGLKPFDGACAGVYVHGMAGEMLRKKIGDAGALASDLLPLSPQCIRKLL